MTSKRLEFLEKTTKTSEDPFAWYGLAMEYRSLGRNDEALATFARLRHMNPAYVPMYLMCGQMLTTLSRVDEAREWLSAGVEAARAAKNAHALGELESALAGLS